MKKLLYAVVIAQLLFLWQYHGAPFGGFLAFSEAYYAIQSADMETTGVWNPVVPYVGRIDFNVPPLYAATNYLLHGRAQTPANVRLLPILLNVANILLVYLVVRELTHDETAGVVGGVMYASVPITNILAVTSIPETMLVTWLLLAFYLHLRDMPLLSMAAVSLGIMTKQPAAIFAVVLLVNALLDCVPLRRVMAMAAVAFSLPVAYIGTHVIVGNGDMLAYHLLERASLDRIPGVMQSAVMFEEVTHATVAVLLLFILSIPIRDMRFSVAGQAMVAYALFFVFYHHHSYYMFPAIVFGIIMSGHAFRKPYLWVYTACIMMTVPFTLSTVDSNRGYDPGFQSLTCRDYVAGDDFVAYWWPVFKYHCPEHDVYTCDELVGRDVDAAVMFEECDGNPHWMRASVEECKITTHGGFSCPIDGDAPTFRWSQLVAQ